MTAQKKHIFSRLPFVRHLYAQALWKAIGRADMPEAERLLAIGANPNLHDAFSGPALAEAVRSGSLDMVKLILAHGGDINGKSRDGNTALHAACFEHRLGSCQRKILEYLLAQNARQDIRNAKGMTPLAQAHAFRLLECERLLSIAAGIEPRDELKPFLQPDGSYRFKVRVNGGYDGQTVSLPDLRQLDSIYSPYGRELDLQPLADKAARIASALFGLPDVKTAFHQDDGRLQLEITPQPVWRARAERAAKAERAFNDTVGKGLPATDDIRTMKPIRFKTKQGPAL